MLFFSWHVVCVFKSYEIIMLLVSMLYDFTDGFYNWPIIKIHKYLNYHYHRTGKGSTIYGRLLQRNIKIEMRESALKVDI